MSSIFPPRENLDDWDQIKVGTISCNRLIEKYGKPDYIKVDIEGADNLFLLQLHESKHKPKYISAESHQLDIFVTLSEKLGYKSFKLVEGRRVGATYRKKKIFSRYLNRNIRFFNAGSSESFGNTKDVPANEDSKLSPRSPYAVAKSTASWHISTYRDSYDIFACTGYLSNHESPLRHDRFVTQKIINGIWKSFGFVCKI